MTAQERTRPGPTRRFSHDEILDAAFDELATRGSSALSLRAVAAAVGVAPTALYTYFPSKKALMSGMVERLLRDLQDKTSADAAASPREDLHALAAAVHRTISERPGAASLLITGPLDGPAALAMNERLINLFLRTGLDEADAARASYALQVFVLGSAILAAAGADAAETHVTAHGDAIAPGFPHSRATAQIAVQHDSLEQFDWGLQRVLDGLVGGS